METVHGKRANRAHLCTDQGCTQLYPLPLEEGVDESVLRAALLTSMSGASAVLRAQKKTIQRVVFTSVTHVWSRQQVSAVLGREVREEDANLAITIATKKLNEYANSAEGLLGVEKPEAGQLALIQLSVAADDPSDVACALAQKLVDQPYVGGSRLEANGPPTCQPKALISDAMLRVLRSLLG